MKEKVGQHAVAAINTAVLLQQDPGFDSEPQLYLESCSVSGGTAVQPSALSPHREKVLGLIPGQDVSVWRLYLLPVSVWVLS